MLKYLELDKKLRDFSPGVSNPYLYHFNYLDPDLTKANFDRNQLSPVSIGFSPLAQG